MPMQSYPEPCFSEGTNIIEATAEVKTLLNRKWTIDDAEQGLIKTFNFPTYAKALDFMILVGIECKVKNHHPEVRNSFRSVYYHWTTHRPEGLSSNDIYMANFCEERAKHLGALENEAKS